MIFVLHGGFGRFFAFNLKAKKQGTVVVFAAKKVVNCRQYGSLLSALLTPPVKSHKCFKMPDVPAVWILFFCGNAFFRISRYFILFWGGTCLISLVV